MKAAVYHGPAGSWPAKPITIEEVPTPVPGPRDVLAKVVACGLCHTDLTFLKSGLISKEPPIILGHEPSGVVVSVGAEVQTIKPGARVIVSCNIPCMRCNVCRAGHENQCFDTITVGFNRDGGLAEYIVAPELGVYPIPDGLPLEESCIVADIASTAYHGIYQVANVQPGDVVAIFGASGGLGLMCVQYASAIGAHVIAIGRKKWKLEKAKELGASEIVSTEGVDRLERTIKKMTAGGADICIEATAVPAMFESALKSTRTGGKIVEIGLSYEKAVLELNRLMWSELTVVGSRMFNPMDIPRVLELMERGTVSPTAIVSHRFKLEEINEAYRMLQSGELLRGIVVM